MPIKFTSNTLLSARPITSSLLLSVLLTSCGAGTEGISKQNGDNDNAAVEIPTLNQPAPTIGAANSVTESTENGSPLAETDLTLTPDPAESIEAPTITSELEASTTEVVTEVTPDAVEFTPLPTTENSTSVDGEEEVDVEPLHPLTSTLPIGQPLPEIEPIVKNEPLPEVPEVVTIVRPSVPQVIVVPNRPPIIRAPQAIEFSNRSSRYIFLSTADPDNDELELSWIISEQVDGGDLTIIKTDNVNQIEVRGTVEGNYSVTAEVFDGEYRSTALINVTITDAIESVPVPTLSRQSIESIVPPAESLYAEHEQPTSNDSKPLFYTYVWYADGMEIEGNINPYIRAENIAREVTYTVALKVSDGTSQEIGEPSKPYIIENQPPEFDLSVSPNEPMLGMDIQLTVENESDAENDPVEYTYEWFVNDALAQGETGTILSSSLLTNDDEIYARVIANDGYDSVVKQTEVLTYEPSPPDFIVLGQPEYLTYGEDNTFQVEFVAHKDGTSVETKLVAGPEGLEYKDGYLSWNPKPIMFTDTETYYAYFEAENAELERVDLTVNNIDHKPTLVKGTIEAPAHDDSIFVGDFHSTGGMEILTVDSRGSIYTAAIKNGELVQTWQYPFKIPTIDFTKLVPFGDDSDGFFVVTLLDIYKIDTKESKPKLIYSVDTDDRSSIPISNALYQDFDQDGQKELAVINFIHDAQILNPVTFEIDRTITFDTSPIDDTGILRNPLAMRLAANIDNDDSIEIISASGEVFDGATGELEWLHSEEFGKRIRIGDINGDGKKEIVSITEQNELKVFNPRTKSETLIAQLNACSFRLMNVDDDAAEELVSGDCDTGQIKIHDLSSDSLDLQYFFDPHFKTPELIGSNFRSEIVQGFNIADLNGDGVDELIWTQQDLNVPSWQTIAAASIPNTSGAVSELIKLDSVNYPQALGIGIRIDLFGRSEISQGDTRTVYSRINVDYVEEKYFTQLLTSTDNGDEKVLGHIDGLISPSKNEFFIDSNGDGVLETLFNAGNSTIEHRSLDDFSLIDTIQEVSDIDGTSVNLGWFSKATLSNGLEVALYSTSDKHFHVYDVINHIKIWKSPPFDSFIYDFLALENEGKTYFFITTDNETSKWTLVDGSYSKIKSIDQTCRNMETVTRGDEQHIYCEHRDEFDKSYQGMIDFDLNQVSNIGQDYGVDPLKYGYIAGIHGSTNNYLFVNEINNPENSQYNSGKLNLIDSKTGLTIWDPEYHIDERVRVHAVYKSAEGHNQLLMHSLHPYKVILTR